MEKRKHPRLPKCLPLEFEVGRSKSAKPSKRQGVLGNISLGGMFFQCKEPPKVEQGQVLEFTVAISSGPLAADHHEVSYFKGEGAVVRVDHPKEGSPFFGIAVQFSQPLSLAGIMETHGQVPDPAPPVPGASGKQD
ncbi:MAG: PilZ domain-containing protein [Thermodesulfobacteriota bacterium]